MTWSLGVWREEETKAIAGTTADFCGMTTERRANAGPSTAALAIKLREPSFRMTLFYKSLAG
jgi:hypothetical protein